MISPTISKQDLLCSQYQYRMSISSLLQSLSSLRLTKYQTYCYSLGGFFYSFFRYQNSSSLSSLTVISTTSDGASMHIGGRCGVFMNCFITYSIKSDQSFEVKICVKNQRAFFETNGNLLRIIDSQLRIFEHMFSV